MLLAIGRIKNYFVIVRVATVSVTMNHDRFAAGSTRQYCNMTELSHELERQALTGHETSSVTTQFGEGIHEWAFGESQPHLLMTSR